MKKLMIISAILFAAGMLFASEPAGPEIDPEIVGRWDYQKTVLEDGTEVHNIIGMEHYYADGTAIFANLITES